MNLTFRKTGIPDSVKRRALLLLAVFFVSLIVFFIVLNIKPIEPVTAMSDPVLPTISVETYGQELAPIHGYVRPMEAAYMRDSLIPLEDDRKFTLHINSYNNEIKGLTLELRSLDTSRKIAQTEVEGFTKDGDVITCEPVLANLLDEGQEYMLVIQLSLEDRDIYYYTRVTKPSFKYTKECLEFARDFHNKSLTKAYKTLATYLEPKDDVNTDSLSYVDIHSSLDQIGWKGLEIEEVSEPQLHVGDMSDNDISVTLTGYVSNEGDRYYVREYYRLRRGEERVYLLDYERTMDRQVDTGSSFVTADQLELGLVSTDPVMMSNETGNVVAFAHLGNLYEYNQNRRLMTEVFSFSDLDASDERVGNQSHGIRILNIDESGTMDFVVYGYMNSGAHEGECGIDIFHYNSSSDLTKEIAFLATTRPYQILTEGISDLLYRSMGGLIYIMVDGTLERIDPVSSTCSDMLGPLADNQYVVSRSGRYLAWIEGESSSKVMHVMDLNDESKWEISAEEGELIRPLAFMTEDLVYGCIREKDLNADARKQKITPMYKILITEVSTGELIKEYSKKTYYTKEAVHDSYALYLKRVKKRGKKYISAKDDTILASGGEQNQTVSIAKQVSEDDIEYTYLNLAKSSDITSVMAIASRRSTLSLRLGAQAVEITIKINAMKYYVYVCERIVYCGTDLKKAIADADDKNGVVVDNHQSYIWRNGRSLYKLAASSKDASKYDSKKKDDMLDLTGCSISQILYYVYLGEPSYGMLDGEMVTITGYNSHSITVYSPNTGRSRIVELDDADEAFSSAGNIFYVEHEM